MAAARRTKVAECSHEKLLVPHPELSAKLAPTVARIGVDVDSVRYHRRHRRSQEPGTQKEPAQRLGDEDEPREAVVQQAELRAAEALARIQVALPVDGADDGEPVHEPEQARDAAGAEEVALDQRHPSLPNELRERAEVADHVEARRVAEHHCLDPSVLEHMVDPAAIRHDDERTPAPLIQTAREVHAHGLGAARAAHVDQVEDRRRLRHGSAGVPR
jgi:hypothetical protein